MHKNIITTTKKRLDYIIPSYSFYLISEEIDIIKTNEIFLHFEESKAIIINHSIEKITNDMFFIIGFKKTIILIKQSLLPLLNQLFSSNYKLPIYFLSDTTDIFNQLIQLQNEQIRSDPNLIDNISILNKEFTIPRDLNKQSFNLFTNILFYITGYLIEQCYYKPKSSQIKFKEYWTKDEYIELNILGQGSSFTSKLVYMIDNANAQIELGLIYYDDKYIKQDINTAIHFFFLAANQNESVAQFNLGLIYHDGKYIKPDINIAIHYYSLAANQNDSAAQYHLGLIYYDNKYIKRNINKAIHYFTLAAKQNKSAAQYILGNIYYDNKYIKRDINKAILYFSLAANQNNANAQTKLGIIYYEDKYIKSDIDKAIYFISLAANQNNQEAQFYLGLIYYNKRYAIQIKQ